MTNVTIGNGVTNIGPEAFAYCTSLTSITISHHVTSIGSWAFIACANLTSVTIPNSVTSIGDYAFDDCTNLTGVYFQGNAPSVGSSVFSWRQQCDRLLPAGDHGLGELCPVDRYSDGAVEPAGADQRSQLWRADESIWVQHHRNSGLVIVVEACTNLANPVWSPVETNTLTGGSSYFSDPMDELSRPFLPPPLAVRRGSVG